MPPVLGPVSPSPSRLWSWAAGSRSSCAPSRSEEHTSELQSQSNLVCRLLLEKKKQTSTLLITGRRLILQYTYSPIQRLPLCCGTVLHRNTAIGSIRITTWRVARASHHCCRRH